MLPPLKGRILIPLPCIPGKNCYKDKLKPKMPYPHEFESVSKLDWHFTVVVSQEIPENKHCCDKNTQTFSLQIFQDDISVVVCFEEPICLVSVVLPHISKCLG